MSNYDAYIILLQNNILYIKYLFLCILLFCLIYRKLYFTILDPLFMGLVSSMFAIPVFLTLYSSNYISQDDFISFLFSEIFLFLGISLSFRANVNTFYKINYVENSILLNKIKTNSLSLFYLYFTIYIFLQLIVYKISGIPLFNASRLDDFAGGTGYGIFSRFIEIALFFALFFFYLFLLTSKFKFLKSILPIVFFLAICFNLFLSGSKSAFIIVFQMLLAVAIILKVNGIQNNIFKNIFKYKYFILFCITIGVLLLFFVVDKVNRISDRSFIDSLILRLIHFGDIYWYAYPNKAYNAINNGAWFNALFSDTLGLLKIVSWEKLPTHIGYKLYQIFHPSLHIQGANARFNVFGTVYFGQIGVVIYSFLIGLLLGGLRLIIFKATTSFYLICFAAFFFIKSYIIFVDITLFMASLNNLIFIFPVFIIIGKLMLSVSKK